MSKVRGATLGFMLLVVMALLALMLWQQWEKGNMKQELNQMRKEVTKYEKYMARYEEEYDLIFAGSRTQIMQETEEWQQVAQQIDSKQQEEMIEQLEMRSEDQQFSFWVPGPEYGLVVFHYYGNTANAFQVRSVMTRPYHLHVYMEQIERNTFNGQRQGQVMIMKLEGEYQQQFLQILKW